MDTEPTIENCSTCYFGGDPCESYNRGYGCHRWVYEQEADKALKEQERELE